jgi:lipoprotein-anchoring transpeptidase ErfK/SrfK
MAPRPQVWLASLVLILSTGCAHTPPEQNSDRPAPEPKAADQPTSEGSLTEPADAAQDKTSDRPKRTRTTRAVKISLAAQQFTYLEDGRVSRIGPISSGTEGHSTPIGRFAVLDKDKDKVSSRYTNQLGMQAWMPYAIRFHGHYYMHEGWLPGHPDSHGCIRLGEQDARFLYDTLRVGDRVEVAP